MEYPFIIHAMCVYIQLASYVSDEKNKITIDRIEFRFRYNINI